MLLYPASVYRTTERSHFHLDISWPTGTTKQISAGPHTRASFGGPNPSPPLVVNGHRNAGVLTLEMVSQHLPSSIPSISVFDPHWCQRNGIFAIPSRLTAPINWSPSLFRIGTTTLASFMFLGRRTSWLWAVIFDIDWILDKKWLTNASRYVYALKILLVRTYALLMYGVVMFL
jgi:hypothetical protein